MEPSWKQIPYVSHLSGDARLKPLIAQQGPVSLQKKRNIYGYLCASIISQQLSPRAASVIHQRFLQLFGGALPSPEQILESPDAKLREIGLSAAKAGYIKSVAQFELDHGMGLKIIGAWTDEEIIDYLTQIKGVGRWTVEMLLLFALGREDVFAVDDLGIRNAMTGLYRFRKKDPKSVRASMLRISESWRPYRSYACLHLWRWKDGE
jgi:DNA-3-methyladenine glycosylase II